MRGSGIVAIGALVVWGLIVADIWRHPSGTQAAASGVSTASTPFIQGLTGGTVG